jgi:hypothetical protein
MSPLFKKWTDCAFAHPFIELMFLLPLKSDRGTVFRSTGGNWKENDEVMECVSLYRIDILSFTQILSLARFRSCVSLTEVMVGQLEEITNFACFPPVWSVSKKLNNDEVQTFSKSQKSQRIISVPK